MAKRDTALSNMKRFIGVPYVYGGPTRFPSALNGTDCRGAVIASWEDADPGCMGGSTYTGDMLPNMLATGKWREVSGRGAMSAGDVVLTAKRSGVVGHTAMYDGVSLLYEEWPSVGRVVAWYEYPWEHYLHYIGETDNEGTNLMPTGEPGTYTVVCDSLNVRDNPSLSANVVASYKRGETVYLEATEIYAEGYLWGMYTGSSSGAARYVAICKVEATETYLEA